MTDIAKAVAQAYIDMLEAKKKKMDPVDKSELSGEFDDREDKDIDNDGDTDSSDKYLHKKRQAISKATEKDTKKASMEESVETTADKHRKLADMHKEKMLDAKEEDHRDGMTAHRMAHDAHQAAAKAYDKASDEHKALGAKMAGQKAHQASKKANGMFESVDEAFKLDPAAKARDDEMKAFFKKRAQDKARSSGEDKSVTKKVASKDSDATHVGSTGHEHVYAGSQPDRGTHVYHIHNTKTGKTHTAAIDHSGRSQSHNNVHKAFGGKVSTAASKIAHKDHRSELKESFATYAGYEVKGWEVVQENEDGTFDAFINGEFYRNLDEEKAKELKHKNVAKVQPEGQEKFDMTRTKGEEEFVSKSTGGETVDNPETVKQDGSVVPSQAPKRGQEKRANEPMKSVPKTQGQ